MAATTKAAGGYAQFLAAVKAAGAVKCPTCGNHVMPEAHECAESVKAARCPAS